MCRSSIYPVFILFLLVFGYAILILVFTRISCYMYIFFSLLVFFLLFELLCPVTLPCLMPGLLLVPSLSQNKMIYVIHVKVCVLETSFPLFLIIDSVLMALPSLSHIPCALLQPCLFLADVPCPLLFSQDVSWLQSLISTTAAQLHQ